MWDFEIQFLLKEILNLLILLLIGPVKSAESKRQIQNVSNMKGLRKRISWNLLSLFKERQLEVQQCVLIHCPSNQLVEKIPVLCCCDLFKKRFLDL